jgi:hypothetical protein
MRDAKNRSKKQLLHARRPSSGKPLKKPEREPPPLVILDRSLRRVEPLDTIFDEIDQLEHDPPHRGVVMRNARFRPYWIQAEEKEWQDLWEKGVFKKHSL